MVTEFRGALRETADALPFDSLALDAVVAAGARRVRHRRIVTAVGTAGLALAVVLGAATLDAGDDRAELPHPADVRLDDAKPMTLDVQKTRVAPWEVPDDAEGIPAFTEDGLVVQGRGNIERGTFELGLLDPVTGSTAWLPRPPGRLASLARLELGTDRLLWFDWHGPRDMAILAFDRSAGTWTRAAVEVPRSEDFDRFFGAFTSQLADDGRVYLLNPGPVQRWWSVPLAGGAITQEPSLDGTWATWQGSLVAAGDVEGRITVTRGGRPVAEVAGPPEGCTMPGTSPAIPPIVSFAGTRLVTTFPCKEGNKVVVYDASGHRELSFPASKDLSVEATDEGHLVLSDRHRIYLLDLESQELLAIDDTQERETADADLGSGMVLWDTAVWNPERDAWDTVHKIARLP